MNRQMLLTEMKNVIGTREPLVYFEKMTELLGMLFDKIDLLENELHQVKTHSALAIQWEPRVAADLLAKQIDKLREADKEAYAVEITALKQAYAEDLVTQEYASFCRFWQENLGFHPFLDYDE